MWTNWDAELGGEEDDRQHLVHTTQSATIDLAEAKFTGSALKEAKLDLKFDEISSITGE